MANNYEKMMNTKVEKLIFTLAVPTIISMLITAIYNIADTYYVTHIDDSAGAAVSVAFSLQSLIQAIGFTIGMGSGSMISRMLGAKKEKEASKYASQGFMMGAVLGTIFLILGLCLNGSIMKLLGASETSLPYAEKYSFWIFIACPFMICSFIMNNILRSEGKARLSMIGLGIGGILNLGLDPLFIYAFDMGISGAGLATMASQIISFCILAGMFIAKKSTSRIWFTYITKDVKSYLQALALGAPTLCRQGFASSANIILNFLAKPYGDSVVAALGITSKVYLLVRNLVVGIGQGYQPVLGFSYGARQYKRIRAGFRFTVMLQTVVSLVATMIVLVFPKALAGFFSDSEAVIEVGKTAIRFLAFSLPFLGFSTIVNQALQVTGYAKSASFLASCRQGIVYTPLIFLMKAIAGQTGLCLSQPLSDFITALISIPFCFYFFRMLKRKEQELNNEANTEPAA